ncbi:MAG: monovalent cation/H(+) antiporter subunit G, partial [Alkalispirochaetaceae bacterium]
RLQVGSLCSTTAVVSVLIGSLFWVELGPMTGRLLVLFLFFLVSGPTSTHIIGRYAWRRGVLPWRRPLRWGNIYRDEDPDGGGSQ